MYSSKVTKTIPKKLRHPPAVAPRTHSPSNTLISHLTALSPCCSLVKRSGFKLQISNREKYLTKSLYDIQNSPSASNINPNDCLSESDINLHSGDLLNNSNYS